MTRVFYDMMPDYTVSVFLDGHWDFFKSMPNLVSYCDSEYADYELISIDDMTREERVDAGLLNAHE
ncbi:hypothetical protein [Vibrio sp. SCSIO 43137]|uniref:hypothetical protein n=1 Tax=Vibrio sp. SCSIO 43137 TaxID=3021011 RepID=UPI002307F325|nr:hypothetical protein [Vibrio sp. SCSIO 43137]WCE32642.1 hypothetical protein PK654_19325 [Vibrio sp. SCSIO 43137]